MKSLLSLFLALSVVQGVCAQGTVNPRKEIESHPGKIDAAVQHLSTMLGDRFRKPIFAEFDAGRIDRPNETVDYAANRILALQRMGELSVHDPLVKNAFTYSFLTAINDSTRLHEALALYERLPVAHTDDPTWRLIRARCARLMNLPETLELYEQVAADMTGVAPSEAVRKVWDANRDEFNPPDYIKEAWRKQTTSFIYDAQGQYVPGCPPIEGSPLPLIDLVGSVGTDASVWEGALGDLPNATPQTLDALYGEANKFSELPWRNGRGFLNTEMALNLHLISEPGADLASLRRVQEAGYLKAVTKDAGPHEALALFRRYPLSTSAQMQLLKSAQRHLFEGEPQSAYRNFLDVLRHAETRELREQSQVGMWVSLAQFAKPDTVAKAFDGVDAEATWPWYGKLEKASVIKSALVKDSNKQTPAPTLASLKQHIVRLPPAAPGATNQLVFNVNLQRRGDCLLASSDGQLVMYDAANPGKPIWSHTQRVAIPNGNKPAPGAPLTGAGARLILPLLGEQHVVATWGGSYTSECPVVTLHTSDGSLLSTADPHRPQSRYRYRTTSSPAAADGSVFATQIQQPFSSIYGHPEYRGWGEVALSCFEEDGLTHRWTRVYEIAQANMVSSLSRFKAVLPEVSEGAVYFCTNDGHVIRADARDGELEWIHFFRPQTNDSYSLPASPRCLGARPIVTDDKVICMPKFTGYLFALDKTTGRRIWRTPLLRGHEVLGIHGNNLIVASENALYALDIDTGRMIWSRSIVDSYADGFQLPRSQMVDGSIYCGTKNTLYRFDATRGALLESRDWAMPGQVPMSFLVSGSDLYVVSDLPIKDELLERQLVDYHTVVYPSAQWHEMAPPIDLKDGGKLIWRDSMLICIRDGELVWSRFVSNDKVYQSRLSERDGKIGLSWAAVRSGTSAVHDAATGQLLSMRGSRTPKPIIIKGN